MYGIDEKLGDDGKFKVNLELFRDREKHDGGEIDVEVEPSRDIEEFNDDGFEVKVEKKYPLYPDIEQYNESFRSRSGYRLEWPNKECKYFLIGGPILGFIVGVVIDLFVNSKKGVVAMWGIVFGWVIGYVCWQIYEHREVGDEIEDEEEDDEYDKLWK